MALDAIDHALARVTGDRERISINLVDLDNNQGHQFLKGAALSGRTEQRWAAAAVHTTELWQVFDAYRRVVEQATAMRAQISRPSHDDLAELTRLLTGESVELPREQSRFSQRTLLDPTDATERLTLDKAVARMTTAYDSAVEMISAADSAWTVLLPRLQAVEEAWARAETRYGEVGVEHTGRDRLAGEIAALRDSVRSDPLSFLTESGPQRGVPDPARLAEFDRRTAEAEELAAELTEAAALKADFEPRFALLTGSVDAAEAAARSAVDTRAQVVAKISAPAADPIGDHSAGLRARLDALGGLRAEGRWGDLAAAMADLQAAADTAAAAAHAAEQSVLGLLGRRSELRGRLDAYKIKAVRLGCAEDPEVIRLHSEARDLLWSAPCDLRAATKVLAQYQQAIQKPGGSHSGPVNSGNGHGDGPGGRP
ncbi:hypothetical protein [Murinocardiopsis flavida]|nr:hypothetical protein [Murinocardiopsis flavida]